MTMSRLPFTIAAVFAAVVGFAAQPNVVLLCVDDLKPELGCYGAAVKTPHIDRLAARGALFERHYIQQAVCGPSRASMFTGLRPDTTRIWDLQHTCREECPQAFTMQEYFKKHGYQTAGSGKVMHGFKNDDPASWTIPFVGPEQLTYAGGRMPALYQEYQDEAVQAANEKLKASGLTEYAARQKFMAGLGAKPPTECLDQPDDAYSDGAMTTWATNLLDRFAKDGKPFFLTLGYRKPHLPFVAPKKYWDLYDRKNIKLAEFRRHAEGSPEFAYQPGFELGGYSGVDLKQLADDDERQRELIHGYYACVSFVDAQIGRLLDKLAETGLATNTIIVLWGDHGWHLGDHNIWCKHSNFEQATRSPLIVAAPGQAKAVRSAALVESVDIFPTLCGLSGLPVPAQLEGASLVSLLRDPAATMKPFAISQYPDHAKRGLMGYSLRNERYRLVTWVSNEVAKTGGFAQAKPEAVELYDYQNDPLEKVNRANAPDCAAVLKQLTGQMEKYFESRRASAQNQKKGA
jgi:arylsulfatase A-like enzyme